jgi:hypothetical protein
MAERKAQEKWKKPRPAFWLGWRRCARLFSALAGNGRECRSVELRALCNEVPRTPPGPEGSNGTGITSGAADHPKFLSLETVCCNPLSVYIGKMPGNASDFLAALFADNFFPLSVFSESNVTIGEDFFSLPKTEN